MTSPVIELRDIRKNYSMGEIDVPVLQGVSISIERGTFAALIGASGSGKSTLMNIIGCLDLPTSGQYVLNGQDVSALTSDERAELRNSEIGFVFQSFQLLRRTTALENVLLPLQYSHDNARGNEERGRMLLERVGLGDRMHHMPTQLSGGQQQRVALARSLINQPSILLADEPTGNLDTRATAEVLDLLREINQRDGVTIIVVTHEPDVARHADVIFRMKDGKISEHGEASELE